MKTISLAIFLLSASFCSQPASAALETAPPENFSAAGTITVVDGGKKAIRVKVQKGLELTFFVVETTEITKAGSTKSFQNLAPLQEVQIEYLYNEDYEKVALKITEK